MRDQDVSSKTDLMPAVHKVSSPKSSSVPSVRPQGRKTQRRGSGEGALRWDERRQGWLAMAEAGPDPVTGKRRRLVVRGKTKTDALAKLRTARERAEAGVPSREGSVNLATWLDHWLSTVIDGRVGSDNTRANYAQAVRVHIIPALGKTRLDKLTPEDIDRFLAAKAEAGLSRTYVARIRTLLADALRHAERRGLVNRNAAALSVMPRTKVATPRRSLSPTEARAFLEAATGERLQALFSLGMTLGLRPGELTGLLWSDLDLGADPPTLSISGSMKRHPDGSVSRGEVKRSRAGLRTIALPPLALEAVRAHRKRQAEERLAAGEEWNDNGLVFSSEIGTPLDPSDLRRTFARVAKKAGVDVSFPYMLRHTAVSLLIDAGKSIETVADMLGDDPRTLYRHYRHRVRPVADASLAMQAILVGAEAVSTS
jgi:integrase